MEEEELGAGKEKRFNSKVPSKHRCELDRDETGSFRVVGEEAERQQEEGSFHFFLSGTFLIATTALSHHPI